MTDSKLAELIRPFWSAAKVCSELSVEEGALAGLRAEGLILGVVTSDETWLYPVFQFDRVGDVTGVSLGVTAVLRELRDVDPWAVAVLIKSTPAAEFDGLTPLEAARDGRSTGELQTFAAIVRREWTI